MAIIQLTSGRAFSAYSKTTMLDAASAAGITLPYSCRIGRCSACKALVKNGQTRALSDESGLRSEEIAAGWILTCVRIAETNVVLDIEDLGDITVPPSKTLPCRIAELNKLTADVLRVTLRLPPTSAFSFIPGQYINIISQHGIRRSYSLANASRSDKLLELHIRAVNGGEMSDYWFNRAKVNDLLLLNGPMGTFFLRECANIDITFLATGTGIAPIKAMLESLMHLPLQQQPRSITVLWGARTREDFYIDITAIPGTHRYVPVISQPDKSWTGARGYVQDSFLSGVPDLSKAAVYACGSEKMILSAKRTLCAAGLPLARFYSDAFVSSGTTQPK